MINQGLRKDGGDGGDGTDGSDRDDSISKVADLFLVDKTVGNDSQRSTTSL